MRRLVDFEKQIDDRISQADSDLPLESDVATQYMSNISARRERFEQVARDTNPAVIRPRIEALKSRFATAELVASSPSSQGCWFGHTDKRPVTSQLTIGVEHDTRFERVVICYDASMIPLFIKFNQHDKLILPLDDCVKDTIADWVEERLLEFLDAYLQVGRRSSDSTGLAVDPVCGMRVPRSSSGLHVSHLGHSYYFCSSHCQEAFERFPDEYVRVRTM